LKPSLIAGAGHFRVTEIPSYPPVGEGEHLYVEVEKENLTTDVVAQVLARACGRRLSDVGYAGRKDRHAIARQWLSVHFGQAEDLGRIELPAGGRLEVLSTSRHRNKLRTGHLRGNRFELDIEGVGAAQRDELERALARLEQEGMLHRFGPQRFGTQGSSLEIARAWARADHALALALAVDPAGGWRAGDPLPRRTVGVPGGMLAALRSDPRDHAGALRAAGARYRKLIASAAQAAIFNAVLDARVREGLVHRLRAGDIALGPRGGPFRCEQGDLEDVNRRAAPGCLEVRASAPLPGHSVALPADDVALQERRWSEHVDIDWRWFDKGQVLASSGERRALIVALQEPPRLEQGDDHLTLQVALPRGAFATELLAQIGVSVPKRGPVRCSTS
jgi:tRNA pseudouridine13 synthase